MAISQTDPYSGVASGIDADCSDRIGNRISPAPLDWIDALPYDRMALSKMLRGNGEAGRFNFTARYLKDDKIVGLVIAGRPKEMCEAILTFDDA